MGRGRKRATQAIIRPLTITMAIVIIVGVIIIQFLLNTEKGQKRQQEYLENQVTLDELIDEFLPDEHEIESIFRPQFGVEERLNEGTGFVARDGGLVDVRFSKPYGSETYPVIIIMHGGESSSRSTERIGRVLGKELMKSLNVMTVTIDWREGSLGEEDVHDVVSAVNWIQKSYENYNQQVFLFGLGRGAYPVLQALHEAEADGMVLAYPIVDPYTYYQYLQGVDEWDAKAFLDIAGCGGYSQSTETCLQNLAVVNTMKLDVPTLLIHSASDTIVPITQSEMLVQEIAPSFLTYKKVEDEEVQHDFFSNSANPGFEQGWAALIDWFEEQLYPDEASAAAGTVVDDSSATDEEDEDEEGDSADDSATETEEQDTEGQEDDTQESEDESVTNTNQSFTGLQEANTVEEVEE